MTTSSNHIRDPYKVAEDVVLGEAGGEYSLSVSYPGDVRVRDRFTSNEGKYIDVWLRELAQVTEVDMDDSEISVVASIVENDIFDIREKANG